MEQSILEVVFDTAIGLHHAGLMDTPTMHEFETLCLPAIKTYSPEQIKKIRLKYQISRTVFATYFNISPSTIQKWERGLVKPRGTSLKLLNLVEQKGLGVLA